ncbi:MAG: CinA family protein [Thermodesulfovibrionales bacterium]|nr:CinA family protein [Nitrospinota bacterium]MCG2709760.1 CinA family protein [Thermodesulfovibrionales bacterium]
MDKETFMIIRKVHEIFKKKGLKLSVAESCTGGLISHYITLLPGASAFFEAGVVTYSAESKMKILGLSSDTISSYGVISKETAGEMAERMRLLTKTGCAVSTTGNLGPDVLERKDIGLIYTAVSMNGKTFVRELRLNGKREEIKERAAVSALEFLIEVISNR